MGKEIFILTGLLFISIVVGVWLSCECSRLSKELGMANAKLIKEKQTTNVKTFNFERKNIKEISAIVEMPLEFSNLVTEDEIKESLINEMCPELKSCLEYATDKDISTLRIKCRGRLRVVEVDR